MSWTFTNPNSAVESDTPQISVSQNMVKWASTILSARGRFSQIWKSSRVFEPVASSKGNISVCWIPEPAVSHCTSPRPYRARAPANRCGRRGPVGRT